MRTRSRTPSRRTALSGQPLAITIPESTRDNVAFRALIRQAIPMIRHPEAHSPAVRRQLAETLTRALGKDSTDVAESEEGVLPPHTDAEAPQESEPGCDNGEDWP